MLLLALDTSGAAVTAAVHDGTAVLAERSTLDARRHAELLAPAVAGVLADAGLDRRDLTGVAVGVGPGPFTGLRVGVVTARVFGQVLGIPVHGVCSLDALAEAACAAGVLPPDAQRFAVATDARRREVHWALYRRSAGAPAPEQDGQAAWQREGAPRVGAPGEVRAGDAVAGAGRALVVVGRGPELYPELLGPAVPGAPLDVAAGALAAVAVRALRGGGPALLDPEPLYLRRPDAVVPGARKRVLR